MPDVNALIPALRTAASSDSVSAVVLDYGNVLYAWESHGALAGRGPATCAAWRLSSGPPSRAEAPAVASRLSVPCAAAAEV